MQRLLRQQLQCLLRGLPRRQRRGRRRVPGSRVVRARVGKHAQLLPGQPLRRTPVRLPARLRLLAAAEPKLSALAAAARAAASEPAATAVASARAPAQQHRRARLHRVLWTGARSLVVREVQPLLQHHVGTAMLLPVQRRRLRAAWVGQSPRFEHRVLPFRPLLQPPRRRADGLRAREPAVAARAAHAASSAAAASGPAGRAAAPAAR